MKLKNKEVEDLVFKSYLEEIMQKKKFLKMNRYIQHGTTSCLLHSIAVAYYSYRLCKMFKIKVHERELIRGALLHDYFLYDWHSKYMNNHQGMHGIIHPKIALFNARKDFNINYLESDIIEKHMFPDYYTLFYTGASRRYPVPAFEKALATGRKKIIELAEQEAKIGRASCRERV